MTSSNHQSLTILSYAKNLPRKANLKKESNKWSMNLGPPNYYDAEMWWKTSGERGNLIFENSGFWLGQKEAPQNFLRHPRRCKIEF